MILIKFVMLVNKEKANRFIYYDDKQVSMVGLVKKERREKEKKIKNLL